jgi:hypothetical protein
VAAGDLPNQQLLLLLLLPIATTLTMATCYCQLLAERVLLASIAVKQLQCSVLHACSAKRLASVAAAAAVVAQV